MTREPPHPHSPIAYVLLLIGGVCLVAGIADWVALHREPDVPTPVTLQDIVNGKVGPKAYVEVRNYRLCSHYVKSWDRGGRINDDRLWCTGLVPGYADDGPSESTRPQIIYKPLASYAAQPFLDYYQKQGVLRGRLSKDVGLSAFEKERIAATYPQMDRSSCLALYEDPPPSPPEDVAWGLAFGSGMTLLGLAFTPLGRRVFAWLKWWVRRS